jgi:hypothetical protein
MTRRCRRVVGLALAALIAACEPHVVELATGSGSDTQILVSGAIPKSAIDQFSRRSARVVEPALLGFGYPEPDVAIPANSAPIAFSWEAANVKAGAPKREPMGPAAMSPPTAPPHAPSPEAKPGEDDKPGKPKPDAFVYELMLRGPSGSELRIYTDGTALPVPRASWEPLLRAAQGKALTARLRALSMNDRTLIEAAPLHISVRSAWPRGRVYFRAAEVLERASIEDDDAETVAPEDCMSQAFSIASRGTRLALSCADGTTRRHVLPSLATDARFAGEPSALGNLDPDGTLLARAYGDRIEVIDAATGALIGRRELENGARASDAAWSPDGTTLAIAHWPASPAPPMMAASVLAILSVQGSELGPPVELAKAEMPDEGLRFPAFSPDGRFIACQRSRGGGEKLDDASLVVVAREGGALRSVAAPPVGDDKRRTRLAPSWLAGEGAGTYWILFASPRLLAGKRESERHRLWATWVDLTQARGPTEHVNAPMLLPFQPVDTDNQQPAWALEP